MDPLNMADTPLTPAQMAREAVDHLLRALNEVGLGRGVTLASVQRFYRVDAANGMRLLSLREQCFATMSSLRVLAAEPPGERCAIGKYCRTHGFIHGGEASELRERLEKLDDRRVNAILEDVDARDSCALLETVMVARERGEPAEPPGDLVARNPAQDMRDAGLLLSPERAVSQAPEGEPFPQGDMTTLCVCGHTRDEHGNNGVEHCGATKACRASDGCKFFVPGPAAAPTEE